MAVWLVRAGGHSGLESHESLALDNNLTVIGWDRMPDLAPIQTKEELRKLCQSIYSDEGPRTIGKWVGELWAFKSRMKKDDLVVLPLTTSSAIAIGRVAGDYKYRKDHPDGAHHTRPVKWIRADIPRTAFEQDLLYSFGAACAVCQIQRNNAEMRINAVLEGKSAPALTEEEIEATEEMPDLKEYSRDQIRVYLGQKFKGHKMAFLVNELLIAQGYKTQKSDPGPDGGVDIIAGRGPMGFDSPKLIVQVKSEKSPIDVKVLRSLQGTMKNFGADQGLLVSWSGFTKNLLAESRRIFFEIRLWNADDLISSLLDNYDKLPEDLQAELPLERIWILLTEKEI